MDFSGSEDEDGMRRRLFKGFKQGVRGAGTQHVNFVNDVDLVPRFVRSVINSFPEVADIIHAGVAGGVNFNDIQSSAFGDCLTHLAGIAGFTLAFSGETVDRLGENASGAGLAGTAWTAEKIGMRNMAAAQGVLQRLGRLFLADHVGQGLRTPPAIKNLGSHFIYYNLSMVAFLGGWCLPGDKFWALRTGDSTLDRYALVNKNKSQLYHTGFTNLPIVKLARRTQLFQERREGISLEASSMALSLTSVSSCRFLNSGISRVDWL